MFLFFSRLFVCCFFCGWSLLLILILLLVVHTLALSEVVELEFEPRLSSSLLLLDEDEDDDDDDDDNPETLLVI